MNHVVYTAVMWRSSGRKGSMLVEAIACCALLGVMFTTALPVLRWAGHQRQLAQQREVALQEADNQLERLTSLAWDDLTSEQTARLALSPAALAQLPRARLVLSVDVAPEDPDAKRVHLELRWEPRSGQSAREVQLTTWVYRRKDSP